MGTPDDFNFEIGQDSGESFLENRSLIAAVCKEFFQERIHAEQGRQKQDTTVAILDIGRMNDGVKQQTQRVYENMAFLALDLLARIIAMRIDAGPPCMGSRCQGKNVARTPLSFCADEWGPWATLSWSSQRLTGPA